MYDCLIIGGGPAGLSAAVYMGRFLRKTIVVDSGKGRSTFGQVNENYLGFPHGIAVRDLRRLGREQAERFGVEFADKVVNELAKEGDDFVAYCDRGTIKAKTVILCTGVTDIWPDVPNVYDYVGSSLFWCIICDGHRTFQKRIVCFGNDEDAATTACQFQVYTKDIVFVADPGELECRDARIKALEDHGIETIEGIPERFEGTPDHLEGVCLKDGTRLEADLIFSLYGSVPNNKLAVDVGAALTSKKLVRIDNDNYTTVPGLFCAGDVSGLHVHQVASAVYGGAEAATTANYYLYSAYQKNEYCTPEQDVKPKLELH